MSRFSEPAILLAVVFLRGAVLCRNIAAANILLRPCRRSEAWIVKLHFYSTFKRKEIDRPRCRFEDQLFGNRFVQPAITKALLHPENSRVGIESGINYLRVQSATEAEARRHVFAEMNVLDAIQPILPVIAQQSEFNAQLIESLPEGAPEPGRRQCSEARKNIIDDWDALSRDDDAFRFLEGLSERPDTQLT